MAGIFTPRNYFTITGDEIATIHVVGVCHVSPASAHRVKRIISGIMPQKVLLELCDERSAIIQDDYDNKCCLYRENRPITYLFHTLINEEYLSQREMQILMNAPAGNEMKAASDAARQINNCELFLIDRPSSITSLRARAAIISAASQQKGPISTIYDDVKMMFNEVTKGKESESNKTTRARSIFEDASTLNDQQLWLLRNAMDFVFEYIVAYASIIIDMVPSDKLKVRDVVIVGERDIILAANTYQHALKSGPGSEIVVVVGGAHCQGMRKELNELISSSSTNVIKNCNNNDKNNHQFPDESIYSKEYCDLIKSLSDKREPKSVIKDYNKQNAEFVIGAYLLTLGCFTMIPYGGSPQLVNQRSQPAPFLKPQLESSTWWLMRNKKKFLGATVACLGMKLVYDKVNQKLPHYQAIRALDARNRKSSATAQFKTSN